MKKTVWAGILTLLTIVVFAALLGGCGEEEERNTSYTVRATLHPSDMTVSAEEDVHVVNGGDAAWETVCFHLYPSAFREGAKFAPVDESHTTAAYPNGKDYGGIAVSSVTAGGEPIEWSVGGEDEDMLTVRLPLLPGEEADIGIAFTLDLPQVRHRFGYYDGIVNLGHWYPVLSVYENGGWRADPYYVNGDPFYSDIADYTVSLTAPTGWNVAGTGKIETTVNGDETTTKFTAFGVRDFALAASEKFDCIETTTERGVTVRYYSAGDADAQARLQAAADAVRTFSDLFGDYAYPSLTVVRTPFLYGGMEYPQFVTVSDALSGGLAEEAVIHEVAHQWWYAAVGNDQINEAWMDEGLAEFSVTLFYEANPSYGVDVSARIADAMQGYVLFTEAYEELTKGDTSMNRPLDAYFSMTDYNFHTYVKGELLFDSLLHAVGRDKFMAGLREYYETYRGKIATADGMIACFENQSGVRLKPFFDSWVNGEVGLYGEGKL